jgi:hypothetical protein
MSPLRMHWSRLNDGPPPFSIDWLGRNIVIISRIRQSLSRLPHPLILGPWHPLKVLRSPAINFFVVDSITTTSSCSLDYTLTILKRAATTMVRAA